jgi:hypothetical protein
MGIDEAQAETPLGMGRLLDTSTAAGAKTFIFLSN